MLTHVQRTEYEALLAGYTEFAATNLGDPYQGAIDHTIRTLRGALDTGEPLLSSEVERFHGAAHTLAGIVQSKGHELRAPLQGESPVQVEIPSVQPKIPQTSDEFSVLIRADGPGVFFIGNKSYLYYDSAGVGLALITLDKGRNLHWDFFEENPENQYFINVIRSARPGNNRLDDIQDVTEKPGVAQEIKKRGIGYPTRAFLLWEGGSQKDEALHLITFPPMTSGGALFPVTEHVKRFLVERSEPPRKIFPSRPDPNNVPGKVYIGLFPDSNSIAITDPESGQQIGTLRPPIVDAPAAVVKKIPSSNGFVEQCPTKKSGVVHLKTSIGAGDYQIIWIGNYRFLLYTPKGTIFGPAILPLPPEVDYTTLEAFFPASKESRSSSDEDYFFSVEIMRVKRNVHDVPMRETEKGIEFMTRGVTFYADVSGVKKTGEWGDLKFWVPTDPEEQGRMGILPESRGMAGHAPTYVETKTELKPGRVVDFSDPIDEALKSFRELTTLDYLLDEEGNALTIVGANLVFAQSRGRSQGSSLQIRETHSWQPYPAGTQITLVTRSDSSPTEYILTLPQEYKTGGQVILSHQGEETLYTLGRQVKGGGFALMKEGEEAGVLRISNGFLELTLRKSFSVAGFLPKRQQVDSLTIQGSDERELDYLLTALAQRGIYNPHVSFSPDAWHLTANDFLIDFIQASAQAQKNIFRSDFYSAYRKPVEMLGEEEADLQTDPFVEIILIASMPDGSQQEITLTTRGTDARLSIGSHDFQWNWHEEGKPKNEVTLVWKWENKTCSITIARSRSQTPPSVNAPHAYDYQISKSSYRESRSYTLGTGEIISLVLLVESPGVFQIMGASWTQGDTGADFDFPRGELSWGESVSLIWQTRDRRYLKRKHFSFTPEISPSPLEISDNLTHATAISLSVIPGHMWIVWEQRMNQIKVFSIDYDHGGQVINLLTQPTSFQSQHEFRRTLRTRVESFGEIIAEVTIAFDPERGWEITHRLEKGEFEGLEWIGQPTPKGYWIQGLVLNARGKFLPAPILPRDGLKDGEALQVTVRQDGEIIEYRLNCLQGKIVPRKIVIPPMPSAWLPLTEEREIHPPKKLFSDETDLRKTSGGQPQLPYDVGQIESDLNRQDLSELLGLLSSDEVLIPTLDSMNRMMEKARRVQEGESLLEGETILKLQFVGSRTPILFEDTFVYNTDFDDPLRWRPVGTEGKKQLPEHRAEWNRQSLQTLYYQMGPLAQQWVPVPPGSTRFYSLPLPGKAGFFVLYNVSGTNQAQLVHRQRNALTSFQYYLHAEASSLHGLKEATSHYGKNPRWEVDDVGQTRVTLEDENGSSQRLSFTAILHDVDQAVQFEKGRTEITVGEGDEIAFRGYFQGFHRETSNEIVFIQIDAPSDEVPRLFRAGFLPGGFPRFIEIPYETLQQAPDTARWLYDQGWVDLAFDKKSNASAQNQNRYLLTGATEPEINRKPIVIEGEILEADRLLLPYLIQEQEWENIRALAEQDISSSTETKKYVYDLMESWLAEGGSDFQLLPQSAVEFRRAQAELSGMLASFSGPGGYEKRKELAAKVDPLYLWLTNGHGVFMQVQIQPHQTPRKNLDPIWVFNPIGRRSNTVSIRFVGKDPETDQWVQIFAPSNYQRLQSNAQELHIFEPLGVKGVVQTLRLVSHDGEKDEEDINNHSLFAFYDKTPRKESSEDFGRVRHWSSPRLRQMRAADRLRDLFGRVEESEEMFRVERLPEEVLVDDQIQFQWTLAEHENLGSGDFTGKRLRIHYPLPHLTEKGGDKLETIPVPLLSTMALEYREDFADPQGVWHAETFKVYRSRDGGAVLVHPLNPRRRYLLNFDQTPGREGYPLIRSLRGFELGLDAFYSPPQWCLRFNVERLRSETATFGGGRVENGTADYRGRGAVSEDDHVYRYFFKLTQPVETEMRFDVVLNASGQMVRVINDSWMIEGVDSLDQASVKTEIVSSEGQTRIYLRHRSLDYQAAIGRTHYFAVDFSTDPETENFLGKKVEVASAHYRRIPGNPEQYLFPSEIRDGHNPFYEETPLSSAVRGDGWQYNEPAMREAHEAEEDLIEAIDANRSARETGPKINTEDYRETKKWFESVHALEAYHAFPVFNTAFGWVMMMGLKAYAEADHSDSSDPEELIDSFAQTVMNAALLVYAERRETLAGELAELVLGILFERTVLWMQKEEILESAFDHRIFKKDADRLKAYHDLSLVFGKIPADYRDRFLKILRKPNIGALEKEALKTFVISHFTNNPSHPVHQWTRRHQIRGWLAPFKPDGGTSGGGGGEHTVYNLDETSQRGQEKKQETRDADQPGITVSRGVRTIGKMNRGIRGRTLLAGFTVK